MNFVKEIVTVCDEDDAVLFELRSAPFGESIPGALVRSLLIALQRDPQLNLDELRRITRESEFVIKSALRALTVLEVLQRKGRSWVLNVARLRAIAKVRHELSEEPELARSA